jgi:hypothetical protein
MTDAERDRKIAKHFMPENCSPGAVVLLGGEMHAKGSDIWPNFSDPRHWTWLLLPGVVFEDGMSLVAAKLAWYAYKALAGDEDYGETDKTPGEAVLACCMAVIESEETEKGTVK